MRDSGSVSCPSSVVKAVKLKLADHEHLYPESSISYGCKTNTNVELELEKGELNLHYLKPKNKKRTNNLLRVNQSDQQSLGDSKQS
jgi:hypothetical protein